ncbi:MAG: hypothetical protein ACRD1N_03185, partial [Terriglobia bacterium]
FLRLSGIYYGLTIALDVLYVAAFHMGAKGIPLALLSSLIVTCIVACAENLAGIRAVLDRALGVLAAKDLVAAALAGVVVFALRVHFFWAPRSSWQLLAFLCIECGIAGAIFVAITACWGIVRFSQAGKLLNRES